MQRGCIFFALLIIGKCKGEIQVVCVGEITAYHRYLPLIKLYCRLSLIRIIHRFNPNYPNYSNNLGGACLGAVEKVDPFYTNYSIYSNYTNLLLDVFFEMINKLLHETLISYCRNYFLYLRHFF